MKKTKKTINVMEPDLSVREKYMLLKTFKKGEISTYGEATNILNKKLKKLCGFRYCFSTTSGSTGLLLAFKAIGLTNNDLVITPSYTFVATISSIRAAGGHPWLFDIQKSNLTLDLDQVERVLKNKTFKKKNHYYHKITKKKVFAIAPVYTNGFICDYKRIYNLAKKYNLRIISDFAGSFLTLTKNNIVSKFSDVCIVSFNGNKSITGGGGGCTLTNKKYIFDKISSLATNATLKKKYHYKSLGYNFKITNLHSSIILGQLDRINNIKKRIIEINECYNDYLIQKNLKCLKFNNSKEILWMNLLYFNNSKYMKKIIQKLSRKNIFAHNFWIPIHKQNINEKFLKENLSITDYIFDKILVIPSSLFLKKKKIIDICKIINN
jgi:perosamine synthetase